MTGEFPLFFPTANLERETPWTFSSITFNTYFPLGDATLLLVVAGNLLSLATDPQPVSKSIKAKSSNRDVVFCLLKMLAPLALKRYGLSLPIDHYKLKKLKIASKYITKDEGERRWS
jgi:hypothetical protein